MDRVHYCPPMLPCLSAPWLFVGGPANLTVAGCWVVGATPSLNLPQLERRLPGRGHINCGASGDPHYCQSAPGRIYRVGPDSYSCPDFVNTCQPLGIACKHLVARREWAARGVLPTSLRDRGPVVVGYSVGGGRITMEPTARAERRFGGRGPGAPPWEIPAMRTYTHLFDDSRECEAPGCRVRCPRSLYRVGGSLLRACCPAHASAADVAVRRREAGR